MTVSDRRLDARLDALPRRAPTPKAWPAIQRRIRRRRRPVALAIAAAIVLATLVAVLTQPAPAPSNDAPASRAGRIYAAEGRVMHGLTSGPAWIEHVDQNSDWRRAWNANRAVISELEAALDANPDSRLLLDLLARAHLRQAELLRRVPGPDLPKPSMRL